MRWCRGMNATKRTRTEEAEMKENMGNDRMWTVIVDNGHVASFSTQADAIRYASRSHFGRCSEIAVHEGADGFRVVGRVEFGAFIPEGGAR